MDPQVAIPMRLDAFVLNPSVLKRGRARIAPITQPNFTGLQIDPSLVQNDVQEHVDLRMAFPVETNNRIFHLDTGKLRRSRCGIYLHWAIPRLYRGGVAATESSAASQA